MEGLARWTRLQVNGGGVSVHNVSALCWWDSNGIWKVYVCMSIGERRLL